jgi:hypothetical protein
MGGSRADDDTKEQEEEDATTQPEADAEDKIWEWFMEPLWKWNPRSSWVIVAIWCLLLPIIFISLFIIGVVLCLPPWAALAFLPILGVFGAIEFCVSDLYTTHRAQQLLWDLAPGYRIRETNVDVVQRAVELYFSIQFGTWDAAVAESKQEAILKAMLMSASIINAIRFPDGRPPGGTRHLTPLVVPTDGLANLSIRDAASEMCSRLRGCAAAQAGAAIAALRKPRAAIAAIDD